MAQEKRMTASPIDREYMAAAHASRFPMAQVKAPLPARALNEEFGKDRDSADRALKYKRVPVTGVVRYVGPDIYGVPSFELSDCTGGDCHVLACLASEDEYGSVQVGDSVTVQGNYLTQHEPYGVVLKACTLDDSAS